MVSVHCPLSTVQQGLQRLVVGSDSGEYESSNTADVFLSRQLITAWASEEAEMVRPKSAGAVAASPPGSEKKDASRRG